MLLGQSGGGIIVATACRGIISKPAAYATPVLPCWGADARRSFTKKNLMFRMSANAEKAPIYVVISSLGGANLCYDFENTKDIQHPFSLLMPDFFFKSQS